jgi:UTP--glucose-1-phosphate uridylyltransferase
MSKTSVRTAIFPVAGLGTRFLPATKAVPKELLPVIDVPLIQFAIDEARDAGVERMIFVSHPSKEAIENHVRDDADLRETLRERGKTKIADALEEAAIDEGDHEIIFVMQEEPLGLGHAVLCAAPHVLPGPVAVILPDDLILGQKGCVAQMIDAYDPQVAGHMIATMEVPAEDVSKYGIMSVVRREGPFAHCDALVEKPAPEDAPSRQAAVGRYLLDGTIFDVLRTQEPGAGGEIQLTDAIAACIESQGLAGYKFDGIRFDCGSKTGMLQAQLFIAQQDPAFTETLDAFVALYQQPSAA